MRGVEGAGAYRIGHPLVGENERPPFRFQIFLRNMAGGLKCGKYLISLGTLPYPAIPVAHGRKKIFARRPYFFPGALAGRGCPAKCARKSADEEQHEENEQKQLGDRCCQSREGEKTQQTGHEGKEQKCECPSEQ